MKKNEFSVKNIQKFLMKKILRVEILSRGGEGVSDKLFELGFFKAFYSKKLGILQDLHSSDLKKREHLFLIYLAFIVRYNSHPF